MNLIQKIINYFRNSKEEIKKVVWPSKKELLNLTLLVIGFSLGMAIFLGFIDYLLVLLFDRVIIK